MQNPTFFRRAAGFTMIELLIAMAVVGVLSGIAVPTYQGQLQRARRAELLVTMMQVQLGQARWRANNSSYATLAQLGMGSPSASGHYQVALRSEADDGYEVLATATGPQASDTACRHMRLRLDGAQLSRASGADGELANPDALNRKCWSQ